MRSEPVIYVKVVPKGRRKGGVRIDLTDRVLSWVFDDNESKADKLTLTVDNWDLANFDSPVWAKGNLLEFAYGYEGNMAPARQLIIRSVKGATRLSIEAYGTKFLLDREAQCRTFFDVTRSEVATIIAERNGFGPEARTIEDTKRRLPTITQAAITDAKLLRRMAAREGFEFYIDFDGFHFHKRKVGQRPSKSLVWYRDGTGTLLDFVIENDISRVPSSVSTRGRDRIKKRDFEVLTDYSKDFQPSLAPVAEIADAANAKVSAVAQKIIETTTELNSENAKRKARGRGAKRRQQTVKMRCFIVGDPNIFAKSVIRLDNIGKRLSGNYYVKSHKHRGGADYSGELELVRDGHSEKRERELLFRRGKGGSKQGSAKTCPGAISILRRSIRSAIQTRDREYRQLNDAGRQITGDSIQRVGLSIKELRRIEAQLAKKVAPRAALPTIREAITWGSNLSASALLGALPRTRRAGDQVQVAARRAETVCEAIESSLFTKIAKPISDPSRDALATGRTLAQAGILFLSSSPVDANETRKEKSRQTFQWKGGRE